MLIENKAIFSSVCNLSSQHSYSTSFLIIQILDIMEITMKYELDVSLLPE